MTDQWGYGQQMMGMQAGGQQMMGMQTGGQQMVGMQAGGQYVVCMMPCYVGGQGGGQAMAAGQPFAFQQDGGMQQMWMPTQMPVRAASGGGAASAAGARQGTVAASFQPTEQASGAAASGGKEATVFDPSAASFVPAAQKQQQAQHEAVSGPPSSFQMSAGAKAFVLPVEQRMPLQEMANGRFQGGIAADGRSGLGPGAGWGVQHAQGVAEHAQSAPAARPNAADARGWTRTPQNAPPAPILQRAGVDAAAPMDAGSPLHKSSDGKAYVPPHLRNRPAPQGAQDGARKEEPKQHFAKREEPKKKEEEPKPLAAAEFPSLISAVTPKRPMAKKSGMVAKEDDAEAAKPEQKPGEKDEPVLKGTAWGKDAAKEREEAAKRRREEEARAAQEAAARKAVEQEQGTLSGAAELSRTAAPSVEPAALPGCGPAAAARSTELTSPLEEGAERESEATATPEEAPPEHVEATAVKEEEEERAAPEPEAEASERAAAAKGDGKGGGELAAEEAANVDTNDEGGETNGEETNDEASRPETDVSAPEAGTESPSREEAKAEEATTAEPPAAEEASQELATGMLGGIFTSKGKKKLKNLAAPRPPTKDDAAHAAEEAAERARLEEEEAERERRRAEEGQAAERAREEEGRRRAEEAKELQRDNEDRDTEEGTEDMDAATDEVEVASADADAVSDEGEEHTSLHAALLAFRACDDGVEPPEEVATLSAKDDPTGWKPEDTPTGLSKSLSWRRAAEDGRAGDRGGRADRDRDRRGGGRSSGKDWERQPRETLAALSNKAEHAYKRNKGELDREAELTRCAKSLLNKICPDNCSVIAGRIATEAMVKTEEELKIVIHLIFQKALAEPHYCETYVELVRALKGEMPEFPNPDGGKPLTFKAALLNVTQEEYETMTANTLQPTDEEKANKDPEELRFLMGEKKKKLLANMKFIGHLFLKELLGGKVITSVASELLKIDGNGLPEEHVVECVCELISAIGYTLDNSKFQSTLVQVCSRLKDLKGQKNKAGKDILSKRIQFQIQDLLDMRGNNWQKKTFKAAAKTKEEIRADAERDERMKERGRDVPMAEYVIAGKKSAPAREAASTASGPGADGGAWDVVKNKSRR